MESVYLSTWSLSGRLSARSDNDLDMNLINFHVYVLPLSFLIVTKKVIYFSVFSPKHLNSPLNSFASSIIIK